MPQTLQVLSTTLSVEEVPARVVPCVLAKGLVVEKTVEGKRQREMWREESKGDEE